MKFPVLLLAAAAGLAQAQTLRPGLWEFKQTPQLDADKQAKMAQAQKAMQSMSPENRAMLEQMMTQRGISLSSSGGSVTIKTCITREQAERNLAPVSRTGQCTQDVKRSGPVIQIHFVCTDPASEGDATLTLRGGEAFTNDVTVTRQRQGAPETLKVNGEGRWLGAECGDVKPMQTQAKP